MRKERTSLGGRKDGEEGRELKVYGRVWEGRERSGGGGRKESRILKQGTRELESGFERNKKKGHKNWEKLDVQGGQWDAWG